MIYDRMQYLNQYIFDTPENRSGALRDQDYFSAMSEQDAITAIENRNRFWAVLEKWGRHEIDFTDEMMEKYSPAYKERNYLIGFKGMPFKNVGHPAMSTFESKVGSSPYYGKSTGRRISEFLSDASNPKYLKKNPLKKKLVLLT